MRLLLADDDVDIRDLTAQTFRLRGWDVTTAASGAEALQVLACAEFDVLVLDESMAPGSGLEVAAERRRLGDRLPIVLWTGWATTVDEEEVARLDVHLLSKAHVDELTTLLLGLVASGS